MCEKERGITTRKLTNTMKLQEKVIQAVKD